MDPLYATLISVPSIPVLNTDDDFALNIPASNAVLIYETTEGGTSVGDAADNLGVANTVTTTEQAFNDAFDLGGFNLIVVEHALGSLSQGMIERLIGWANRGQKLILGYGEFYNHTDLMAAVGVTATSTFSASRPIFQDRTVPVDLFNLSIDPGGYNSWAQLPTYLSASTVDYGQPARGAELAFAASTTFPGTGLVLARYDSSGSGAPAIMLTQNGRVLVHGFVGRVYSGSDIDYDSIHDLRELYENEILYFYTRQTLGERSGLVHIPPGAFTMGAEPTDTFQDNDEWQRGVTISRDFMMGRTELTNRLYTAITGLFPSINGATCGYDCPVQNLSWESVVAALNSLSTRDGRTPCYVQTTGTWQDIDLDCDGYRLPTEAEWEYAAKAGTTTLLSSGDFTVNQCSTTESVVNSIAWFCGNALSMPRPVGYLQPNPFGLYDMHGNVWEFVHDIYDIYSFDDETDPTGPTHNSSLLQNRIVRGGSHLNLPSSLRSPIRGAVDPTGVYTAVGFRLARTDVRYPSMQVNLINGAATVGVLANTVTFSDPDDGEETLTLPFTFAWGGLDATEVYVSANGVISFDSLSFISFDNDQMPAFNSGSDEMLAAWWDDLEIDGGSVSYETRGVTPNRVFAVSFVNANSLDEPTQTVSFEIQLHETSNVVEVHYGSIATGANDWEASMGWEFIGPAAYFTGADVLGCADLCDETRFPAGQILRYVPTEVR